MDEIPQCFGLMEGGDDDYDDDDNGSFLGILSCHRTTLALCSDLFCCCACFLVARFFG